MPTTAPNHALARETGPPVMTMALARLAKDHSPTTAPVVAMEMIAPLEISAWVLALVCTRVLVVAVVMVESPGVFFVFNILFLCFAFGVAITVPI